VPSQSHTFDAAKELLTMMIARSEGGDVKAHDFATARTAVLADPTGRKLAPECVRICRDPDQVWARSRYANPLLRPPQRLQKIGTKLVRNLGAQQRLENEKAPPERGFFT
jgi:hypothetical protein